MIIRMARCIGQAGCPHEPGARGLCRNCYARHTQRGTLNSFPTMQERAQLLRQQGVYLVSSQQPKPTKKSNAPASARRREKLYAQRVVVGGYTVHPDAIHGEHTAYTTWGCRGPMCRDAQRHYRATGEGRLPADRRGTSTTEECVAYQEVGHYK